MRVVVLLSAAFVAFLRIAPAQACSFPGPTPYAIDPALKATDTMPPTLTVAALAGVMRGKGAQASGCGGATVSSCDDSGSIRIAVDGTDDVTAAADLGFRVVVTAGSPPVGLNIPAGAVTVFGTPGSRELFLVWNDGATDEQEPIDFTLAIVAVDHAGNESAPQAVHISGEGSGCSVASPARRSGLVAFPLLTLAALVSRRRRS